MGGGGFSMEPDNLLLDKYILDQSRSKKPTICFLPTASGDSDSYIQRFYTSFEKLPCTPTHLSLFKLPTRDLEGFLLKQDIIYVGGGNTKNLLALWKEWNLHTILKKALQQGVILAGLSAGSICWFEEGLTDSYGDLDRLACLGFLKGSNCPHFDGEINRKPTYEKMIQNRELKSGYGVSDGAAIHFIDEKYFQTVSSRPNAKAYFYSIHEDQLIKNLLDTKYLG